MPTVMLLVLLATTPVSVSVFPLFSHAPGSFRVRVMVERHAENRGLCLAYDGPEYRRSCYAIDGAAGARVWTRYWFLRIDGDYTATADLLRVEGGRERHYLTTQTFRVIGF